MKKKEKEDSKELVKKDTEKGEAVLENSKEVDNETVELSEENNIELEDISSGEKLLSAIGYISFFCILPLVLKPKSDFCQFHGKQGLVVTLLMMPLSFFASFVGGLLFALVTILYLGAILYAGYSAIQGKKFTIPFFEKILTYLKW